MIDRKDRDGRKLLECVFSVVEELSSLASEVVDVLKKRAGEVEVQKRMVESQKNMRERAEDRKYVILAALSVSKLAEITLAACFFACTSVLK